MAELTAYAASPLAFIFRYIRLRPASHAAILAAVLGAVACSVCTQYGVKFLVDNILVGTEDLAAPYSVSLNTTTLSNGSHSVVAVARDGAGNSTTSTLVAFNVDNVAPTVSVTSKIPPRM